jgi:hypothetical protein
LGAPAIWSAVAQMHGASLHRSYRFRASLGGRKHKGWRVPRRVLCSEGRWYARAVRPAKAVASLRCATAVHIRGVGSRIYMECGRADARRRPASELPLSSGLWQAWGDQPARAGERVLSGVGWHCVSRPACESGSCGRSSLRDRTPYRRHELSGLSHVCDRTAKRPRRCALASLMILDRLTALCGVSFTPRLRAGLRSSSSHAGAGWSPACACGGGCSSGCTRRVHRGRCTRWRAQG